MVNHTSAGETASATPTVPTRDAVRQGAAALAVALLIALASRGAPVWVELADGSADRGQVLNGVAALLLAGLVVAVAVVVIFHYSVVARRPGAQPLSTTGRRAVPAALASLALLAILALATAGRPDTPGTGGALQMDWFSGLGLANADLSSSVTGAARLPTPAQAAGGAAAQSPPLLLVILLLLLVGAVAAVLLRAWQTLVVRRELVLSTPAPPVAAAAATHAALDASLRAAIDAMLRDPDPRAAIIGAYARLLEELAASGAGRRPQEAPLEHLERVLLRLRVAQEPVRELVMLFEVARFSTHPLREPHRSRALAALRAVLESLPSTSGGANAAAMPAPAR